MISASDEFEWGRFQIVRLSSTRCFQTAYAIVVRRATAGAGVQDVRDQEALILTSVKVALDSKCVVSPLSMRINLWNCREIHKEFRRFRV